MGSEGADLVALHSAEDMPARRPVGDLRCSRLRRQFLGAVFAEVTESGAEGFRDSRDGHRLRHSDGSRPARRAASTMRAQMSERRFWKLDSVVACCCSSVTRVLSCRGPERAVSAQPARAPVRPLVSSWCRHNRHCPSELARDALPRHVALQDLQAGSRINSERWRPVRSSPILGLPLSADRREAVVQPRVRRADLDDAYALSAMRWSWRVDELVEAGSDASSYANEFRAWMAARADLHVPFIAENRDVAIGMAWLALGERVLHPDLRRRGIGQLQSVYVVPSRRKSGTGRELVSTIIAVATERDLEYLFVRPNRDAVTFYRRVGFSGDAPLMQMDVPRRCATTGPVRDRGRDDSARRFDGPGRSRSAPASPSQPSAVTGRSEDARR